MKKLINGIIDFRKKSLLEYRNKFSKLAMRQLPDALFIACCDSRVVPNTFASSDPGDLFVLRNIGNLVPIYNDSKDASVASAIEFSLINLNVLDIIVCGHSECGAMCALMEKMEKNKKATANVNQWLTIANSSYDYFKSGVLKNHDNLSSCNLLSQANVLQQLENLKTYPVVMERLQNKQVRIHGWWFDLATANVYNYNSSAEKFVLIDEKEAESIFSNLT